MWRKKCTDTPILCEKALPLLCYSNFVVQKFGNVEECLYLCTRKLIKFRVAEGYLA